MRIGDKHFEQAVKTRSQKPASSAYDKLICKAVCRLLFLKHLAQLLDLKWRTIELFVKALSLFSLKNTIFDRFLFKSSAKE
jgi:hypothetical protein